MHTAIESDVVIVGAGPCGLALANFLGLYGRSVTVLEARETLIDYPRGVGIDDESLRTLQTLGLVDAALPHITPHHIMRLVDGAGRTMLTNDPQTDEFGWGRKHGFIQPEVDRVLYEGLARFEHVRVLFGHEVVRVDEDADGVTAVAAGPAGAEVPVRGRYLVGCEGGKSPTRKRLGVAFDGVSPSTRWLVVDVENDPLGTPNVFLGADPRRPYVSIGLPHGVRRWEFMLRDDETEEQVTSPAHVAGLLAEHVPDPASLRFIRRRVFTHHARVASDFRRGRQLIAGDAAHLMPVWMGQGWNSGIRDATNLGWKLAMVLDGRAGDALLDTYTAERLEHARAMVDLSLTFGRVIKITNPLAARARDAISLALNRFPQVKAYFSEMRFKPMPRYTRGVLADPTTLEPGRAAPTIESRLIPVRTADRRDSPVGVQFPQPRVTTAHARDQRLDDAIGPWWTLITWGNNPRDLLPAASLARFEAMGGRLVAAVPEQQREWAQQRMGDGVLVVGDHTGRLKRWFDARPTPVVVLRPDRFVAGACLAQQGAATLDAVFTAASLRREPHAAAETAVAHAEPAAV